MDNLTFNMGAGVPSNNIPGRLSFSIDGTTGSIYLDRNAVNNRVKFNADAKKLDHIVKINNTDFDGSEDITTEKWGAQRDFTIGNSTVSIDGSDTLGYEWTHNAIGVPRVETLSNLGTDYIFRIIPLCLLDNDDTGRDSYFMGHLFLKRSNLLSTFLTKINIVCGKNYNQALPRYSMNIEGGNAAEWQPVTFTWNSKKYFGLYYKQTGAGYSGHCSVTGHSSDWSIIKVIDVYNYNTSTILNAEVYNSITILESNSYHLPQTAFNDILPRWDKKFNLGAEGTSWRDIYTEQLYITGTSGIGHITFGRLNSYNYLHVPSVQGAIALCANDTLAINNCSLVVDRASARPGENNTFTLGTEAYKWKDAWFSGTVTITNTTDASGSADRKPALIVGGTSTTAHLELDANELMSKSNGTTPTQLYLNSEGGLVHIGAGGLQIDSGDIQVLGASGSTVGRSVRVANANGDIGIFTSTNQGLYDFNKGEWIIYRLTGTSTTLVPAWGTKGSSSLPVYFSGGQPVACNSTLNVSITGSAKIVSRTFDRDTSNALNMVTIYDTNNTTLRGLIGFHNTGGDGTGSAYIIPYPATADSWSGTEGLYIKKGELKIDNSVVLTASNYTNYTVTKTGAGASGTNWGISITGSAGSVAWGNITGKPSSFTPSSHNHSYLSGWGDTRNATTTPNDYNNKLAVVGIKTPTGSGTLDDSSYATLMGIRGWGDSSGGNTHELAFTGNGALYHRHGATTTWNDWKRIPFGDGDGASGTWGISISGHAATAGSATSATSAQYLQVTKKHNANSSYTSGRGNRFYIRQYVNTRTSSTSSTDCTYYEQYNFPIPTPGRSSNISYTILTSKTDVTVAQGGTGSSSAGAASGNALYNLGIRYQAEEPAEADRYEGMIWLKPV